MAGRTSRSARRGSLAGAVPLGAFLLVIAFGILFAGCKKIRGPEDTAENDDFTFTEEDVARFRQLSQQQAGTGSRAMPRLEGVGSASGIILDLSQVKSYQAIRSGPGSAGANMYKATSALAVRKEANASSAVVAQVDANSLVTLVEFVNGAFAKVRTADGKEGFVPARSLARPIGEERLAQEKKQYENLYYVNFRFLNVRSQPNQGAPKIGELPGQAFVRPLSIQGQWAKISFEGKDAYVSTQYLSPFSPRFITRQETYQLSVLVYRLDQPGALAFVLEHAKRLKDEGVKIVTLRDLADALLAQEQRDVRFEPGAVAIALVGLTPQNVKQVSDTLSQNGIRATIFVETRHVGISGITEKMLQTLAANGNDIESAGHTGDDLRSLTNAQVDLELRQSRKILEDATHKTIFAIAYPLGGVNDRVMQKAAEAGYLLGVGQLPDRSFSRDQLLRLPSFQVTGTYTGDDVMTIVRGAGAKPSTAPLKVMR
jgi:peptidoglycan/xylan/chitin deacetylase (PgdA/CDA1 family)/SH3-like domain-containing protein